MMLRVPKMVLLVCVGFAVMPSLAQSPQPLPLPLPPPWPEVRSETRPEQQPPATPASPAQRLPRPPPAPPTALLREQALPVRPADAPLGPVSRQPLPRFASLGSNRINLRTGPGTQYPVEWTYQRAGWPVEVVREFGTWRRVRDHDGAEGWVQQNFLSQRRSFVVHGEVRGLRRRAAADAPVVARLAPGVQGRIRGCGAGSTWCEVETRGGRGYLMRAWFWGTYQGEEIR